MKFIGFVIWHLLFAGSPLLSWKDTLISVIILVIIISLWGLLQLFLIRKYNKKNKEISNEKVGFYAVLMEAGIFVLMGGVAILVEAIFHL